MCPLCRHFFYTHREFSANAECRRAARRLGTRTPARREDATARNASWSSPFDLFGWTWGLTFNSLSWLPLQSVFKETLKAFQTGLRLFITVCEIHTHTCEHRAGVTPWVNYGAAAERGTCLSAGVITSVLCTSDSVLSSFIRNISRKGSDLLKKSFGGQKNKNKN